MYAYAWEEVVCACVQSIFSVPLLAGFFVLKFEIIACQ